MNLTHRTMLPAVLFVSALTFAGCAKKHLPPPPPPPPAAEPAPAPTAQLTATPSAVTAGDQVVLSWKTTNATSVSIDGVGDVPTTGVKSITPAASTTYHLAARGEGGVADATARVTVNQPPVVEAPPAKVDPDVEFKANVHDIFFGYDSYELNAEAQTAITSAVQYLTAHPDIHVVIGGYCDERGSNEYNLGLGQNRANSAKNALVAAGVSAARLRVISYGKEKPFCTESTEACWQENRRDGFTIDR